MINRQLKNWAGLSPTVEMFLLTFCWYLNVIDCYQSVTTKSEWVYLVQLFLSYWPILCMVIGETVELAIHMIGQWIRNPTNIVLKGFLRRQQDTLIWCKQFLYVFVQVAVSECSYYLEWSIVLHSFMHVPGLLLWLLRFSTMGLWYWVNSPLSPCVSLLTCRHSVKRIRIKQTWGALSFTPTPPRSGLWK